MCMCAGHGNGHKRTGRKGLMKGRQGAAVKALPDADSCRRAQSAGWAAAKRPELGARAHWKRRRRPAAGGEAWVTHPDTEPVTFSLVQPLAACTSGPRAHH